MRHKKDSLCVTLPGATHVSCDGEGAIHHCHPALWFQGAKWHQVVVCRYETFYLQAAVGKHLLCCGNWTGTLVKSLCGRSALKKGKIKLVRLQYRCPGEGIVIRCVRRWAGVASSGLVTYHLSWERSDAVLLVISVHKALTEVRQVWRGGRGGTRQGAQCQLEGGRTGGERWQSQWASLGFKSCCLLLVAVLPGPVIPVSEALHPPPLNGASHAFFVSLLLEDELYLCLCLRLGHDKCSGNSVIVIVEDSEDIAGLVGEFRTNLLPKNVLQCLGSWSWWQMASSHTVRVGLARSRVDYCVTLSL